MNNKIYLGMIGKDRIYLEEHKWDCQWYWGFGYLGNKGGHFHIKSMLGPNTAVLDHFDKTWITQDTWWILRDLFIQAYALKDAAETYRLGGHQTSRADPYSIIDSDMAQRINKDLGVLLATIWALIADEKTKRLS